MSQHGAVYVGPTVVQVELPDPSVDLLPGVRWGAIEAFPTPAYWAYQVLARRVFAGPPRHRLGRTLSEEVVACLLGGHGVPANVGLAAFRHLQSQGLLDAVPTRDELKHALSEPLAIEGRTVHYRFATRKADFIAGALSTLADLTPPLDKGIRLRDWLLRLEGVGYKTASWIARNWLDADDIAILDIHVVRAGHLGGFLDGHLDVVRDYLALEQQFLRFSAALGVRPSELDAVIWQEMMSSPRTVHRLLGSRSKNRAPSRLVQHEGRHSDERRSDTVQPGLTE